ncbi:MAG: YcxB family protein [Acidobacteriales bacterium]|nr:YcxB family protein [Terriglobales bacterium]
MNSTVDVSFRYSESDFVRAMRAHYATHLRLRLDIAVAIVCAIVGAYLWRSPSTHWLGIGFVSVSAVFALILVAAFAVIPRLVFRREPKFRDDYSLTFSPGGIHFRTAHIDSQLQWSMYSRALVDAYSYILYYGWRSFTVIPKRVFQSAEQQNAFEHMLAQNIPKISRKDT